MAAPSRHGAHGSHSGHGGHGSRDSPDRGTPKWMFPCGQHNEQELDEFDLMTSESDAQILNHIILQAEIALDHAEGFKNDYVQKTFGLPFEKHHSIWIENKYDWLPSLEHQIPKKLGKKIRPSHLESRGFDEFLKNIYEYLQRFAVGIEQVVWDQEKNSEFKENFNTTEAHLKKVLCEIRTAMLERSVTPNNDIERTIMADEYRNMDRPSYRHLRDWLIFRDYMNGLEYVIQVFKYIKANLPS